MAETVTAKPARQTPGALGAYVIAPWAHAREGTYGSLGIAATLLFGLFLISRLVVAGAVVNATLWERREAAR